MGRGMCEVVRDIAREERLKGFEMGMAKYAESLANKVKAAARRLNCSEDSAMELLGFSDEERTMCAPYL